MRITITKKEYELLLDLEKRLIDDSKPFVQHQEDRLLIGVILDKCDRGKKNGQ